jgi:hypothetical protein
VVDGILEIGGVVLLLVVEVRVVAEGLVVEGVELLVVGVGVGELFGEVDDGEFLLPADVELVEEFVMDLHQLLLEDGDFLLVVAAFGPLGALGVHLL